MALSGSVATGAYSSSGGTRTVVLDWTATQDKVNNKSTISWTLKGGGTNSGFIVVSELRVTIDGKVVYHRDSSNHTNCYLGTQLASGSTTVNHNTDGSKSVVIKVEAGIYEWGINKSGQATFTLNQIPRASTIGATDAAIEAVSMVAVSRKSTAHSHAIRYQFGSITGYLTADGGTSATAVKMSATNIPFAIPAAWYAQIPNATSGVCTLTCTTYSGNTQIGSATTAKFTVRADVSKCAPAVSGAVVDVNEITVALTGNSAELVRYRSTAHCTITATPKNSATIAKTTLNNAAISGSTDIQSVDASRFSFAAVDSRGFSSSAVVEPEIVPYIPLTCNVQVKRESPTGSTAVLSISGNYFAGSFGAQANTLTVKYRLGYSGDYVNVPVTFSGDSYNARAVIDGLDYNEQYTLTVIAQDAIDTVNKQETVKKGEPPFFWTEKYWRFNEPVFMKGQRLDYIAEQGDSGIWYYRKWDSGVSECWGRQTINNFKFDETWGNLSVGHTAGRVNYPAGLFVEPPVEQATAATQYGSCWLIVSSNELGVNTAEQSRGYNVARATATATTETLYIDYYCRGRWKYLDINGWADVQTAVRLGLGPKLFPVGYEFSTRDADTGQDIIWVVRGHDHHTPANSRLTHSMTLEMKYVYSIDTGGRRTMAISTPQALYYAETALEPGTYNFTIVHQDWYPGDNGKTFQFTLTKPIPAGGQIMLAYANGNAAVTAEGKTVITRESQTSVDTLESAVLSLGSAGTHLGQTDGTGNVNHFHRIAHGSNNYAQSVVRQWLNSGADAGGWYQPQDKFAAYTDTVIRAYNGFTHGLPSDFLSVVAPAVVPCRTNNVYECPSLDGSTFETGGTYTVTDKFFLLSRPEIFGTAESDNVKDGEVLEYYEGLTDSERKRYDNAGAVTNMWLRSCYPDLTGAERYVSTTGTVGYTAAINRTGVAAACIIA